ncbi:MAG: hypothetical protein R3Y18_05405 [Bacillota bacterium]
MRKTIKMTALLLCLLLVMTGCGSETVDLTIDGTSIIFADMDDTALFIEQVKDGSIDYDAYEVPTIVKTCATSAMLDELTMLTYFESVADGMALDSVIVGNSSICVVYDLGLDFSEAGLTQDEEYLLNTATLTTYMTDDVDTLFDGFYSSGTYTMNADSTSFSGMYGSYGSMSVSKGADNQVLVMYLPITFSADMMSDSVMSAYYFE